ncbi:Flagellar motor protein [Gaiella occulta]|uniref:Flagellar motor protein n=1 Tax=Gaiella occulta TaxID=1002870 RepID=A0A7M2Z1J1_9ACTN|nr:flagellar motor protein MotB [Gaiella occulta]RDI75989.1 Flagellar motor protein [Gaiella occulta]
MSRRRRGGGEEHGGGGMERWLLTYADMITLLLALFIVLYAMSSVSEQKLAALRASLSGAFSGKVPDGGQSILDSGASPSSIELDTTADRSIDPTEPVQAAGAREAADLARLAAANRQLRELESDIARAASSRGLSDSVETTIDERGLVVRILSDRILFDVGSADLRPGAGALLAPIARILRAQPNPIRVEGHTDSVPIHTARYRSNWELSTARSTTVVHYLLRHGIASLRLSAAGYAAERPVATNASAAGRARNRRIEIVLLRPEGRS